MDYVLTDDYLADAERRARRFMGQWTGTSGALAADVIRLLHDRRRIIQELADMQTTLDEANKNLRAAVEARLAGGCCDGGKCHSRADDAPQRWREMAQASAAKYAAERAIDERGPMIDVDEHIAEDDARTPEADMAVPVDWILQGQRELEAAQDDIRWTGDSILAKPAEGLRPGSREFVDVLDEIKNLHLRKTLDYGIDDDALSNIRESADIVNMPAWAGAILRISDKMHRLKAFFRRGRCEFDGIEDTLKDIASYAAIALVLYREAADPVE